MKRIVKIPFAGDYSRRSNGLSSGVRIWRVSVETSPVRPQRPAECNPVGASPGCVTRNGPERDRQTFCDDRQTFRDEPGTFQHDLQTIHSGPGTL